MEFSCSCGVWERAGLLSLTRKNSSSDSNLCWLVQDPNIRQLQNSKIYPTLKEECQKRITFQPFYVGTKGFILYGLVPDGIKNVNTQWNRIQFSPFCPCNFKGLPKLKEHQTFIFAISISRSTSAAHREQVC